MSDRIRAELARIAAELGVADAAFVLERPRDAGHGDLATNLAMALAKTLRSNPRALAERIIGMVAFPPDVVTRTEIAGPGFINFWLAGDALSGAVREVLVQGVADGRGTTGVGRRVNVEFVSANPTGPLHVGHGRGAALGDAIASLLEWTGHAVHREFYVNDAGLQIDKLARSLWARVQQVAGRAAEVPEGGYHGEYLVETAAQLLAAEGAGFADRPEVDGLPLCRSFAIRVLRQEQEDLHRSLRVEYDRWSSEQSLYDEGKVAHALAFLAERGLTSEQDGALRCAWRFSLGLSLVIVSIVVK